MHRKSHIFILIFSIYSLAHCQDIIHKYTVSISADLSTLYVTAQFANIDFYYLYAGTKSAAHYTKNMYFLSDKSNHLLPEKEELQLDKNAAGQTLHYEFDIESSLGKERWSSARRVGDDVVIPPDLWLWRPYSLQENEHIDIQFNLPKGIKYSTPWQVIGKNLFRIPATPIDWPSASAFGKFNIDTVKVKNCKLSVVFFDGEYQTTQQQLKEWIKGAVQSVCHVYGEFPVSNAQVLIFPGRPGHEPVPFGMVVRGGGITIDFYIDPSRPLQEFIADWTATHELSHCLLPMINQSDAWLSEGSATYYQYILMGRDGRLTEQQTWQRIYSGFQKGIRGSRGETLKRTTQKMRQYRAFRNVYWSGAAMLLKADVALRQQSNGQKSLDTVLKKIKNYVLPQYKSWSGYKMMQIMDELAGTSVFTDIYNQNINSKEFPVDDNYWLQLGVVINDGQVQIDNNAPLAHIRKNLLLTNDY